MKKSIIVSVFALSLFAMMQSCTKANVNDYNTLDDCNPVDTVKFAAKIQPLILQNCATSGCHDANTAESGYDLTTYANISSNASIMLSSMRGNGAVQMPFQSSPLPDSLIKQFNCWIQQGKQNN